jgi:hypothetical protein
MEEEEYSQKIPWSDTSLAKSIGWVFAIVGVLATVAGVVFAIYLSLKEPTSILSATYQESHFVIPDKLFSVGRIDSVIAERDIRIKQLYRALKSHISPREVLLLPDSLQPYGLRNAYYGSGPVSRFAIGHNYFYVLTVKNEGEKTIEKLHLIHGVDADYEFKDSEGVLKQGHSAGNLPLGDLAATESREIYLWTLSRPILLGTGLTVAYSTGKVEAKFVSVTGIPMIEAKQSGSQLPTFISYLALSISAFLLLQLIRNIFAKRN